MITHNPFPTKKKQNQPPAAFSLRHGRTKHIAMMCALALSAACLAVGCGKKESSDDLTSTHTTAAETTAAETTAAQTQAEITVNPSVNTGGGYQTETYTSGKVSIQYPVITSLEDTGMQDTINDLLKENALAALAGYGIDETSDTVDVTCKVLSADRSRVVVTFRGTYTTDDGETNQIFYSSNIDTAKGENLQLTHYADPATLAAYVLSDSVVFPEASSGEKEALLAETRTQKQSYYTNLFRNADFSGSGSFPGSFSYEYEGDIYFSVPVSHELGDYAIVVYTPENK